VKPLARPSHGAFVSVARDAQHTYIFVQFLLPRSTCNCGQLSVSIGPYILFFVNILMVSRMCLVEVERSPKPVASWYVSSFWSSPPVICGQQRDARNARLQGFYEHASSPRSKVITALSHACLYSNARNFCPQERASWNSSLRITPSTAQFVTKVVNVTSRISP